MYAYVLHWVMAMALQKLLVCAFVLRHALVEALLASGVKYLRLPPQIRISSIHLSTHFEQMPTFIRGHMNNP